ncbi:MAG: carboxylesterase family protein [Bacteroidetes bacterium]|jgi:poly(3-hydroxybutyrate) depolymerase|nr:carboxylesterase family protein [Bacteroidota bacterium]MCB0604461.1 carboxylesterase family protein [Saprospiraceae bacterium]MCO5277575.1 carboxylesterase family protein [Saprospiraceae bacterium]
MKKITLVVFCLIGWWYSMAQTDTYCSQDKRFTNTPVFAEDEVESVMSVSYGHAVDYKGEDQNLIFNIYFPKIQIDSFTARPLVVLVHGGGYSGGSLNGLNNYCLEFAKRGYVAATIEYRLGWNRAPDPCDGDASSMQMAFYRSLQDVHAAIRYLVENAAVYGIDTNWIFAGGTSAGAFTTTNLAFAQQAELDSSIPLLHQTLGRIDSSGNALTNTFHLKGLFHNWGSVFDLGIIDSSDAIPLIGFVGDHDPISPIDSGYWQGCTNFPLMFGTRAIHNRLNDLDVCSELNVKIGGGHGVWKDTPEQNVFRIGRACCFFKSIFCNTCASVENQDSIPADCASIAVNETPLDDVSIDIFPNPFTGLLFTNQEDDQGIFYSMMNNLGQVVWTGRGIENMDFSRLASGIYYLQVNMNNRAVVKRLIKM